MNTCQSRPLSSGMTARAKSAFSLIELIAAMSVVLALAIVAFAYASSYRSGVENTKRLSDIEALQNVAESYHKAKGDYPTPRANAIPYDQEGRYSHEQTPYGYSSFVSDDLFGAEFLREVPHDPSNNAYYAYGKQSISEEAPRGAYDFATVDLNEGVYYAYVRGNYDGSRLVSLVRSYNSPEFVQNGTDKYLPYNPYEMKLTGRVTSASGSVFVVHDGTTYGPEAFTGELVQGDTVSTPAGSYATLFFADGSEVRVGSESQTGTINIASLEYKDRSIATRLRIRLQEGAVWTKAPHLREVDGGVGGGVADSDNSIMEVETDSAVAAVRGTIFGVEIPLVGGMRTYIKDGKVELSSGTTVLTSLTGGLGNYEMTSLPAGLPSVSMAMVAATSNTVSFTGGSVGTASCGAGPVNCGLDLEKATGEWNSDLLRSRRPDVSTVERTATGVIVRVEVPEEDVMRWLCAGNASGDALENFADTACLQMSASGSHVYNFEDSLVGSLFSTGENPGVAICKHDHSVATGGSTNWCSVGRVVVVDASSAFWPVRMDGRSLGCEAKDSFGTLGCLGEDTLAYAPYDLVGDLNMYARNPYSDTPKLIKLPVKTNGWHATVESGSPLFSSLYTLAGTPSFIGGSATFTSGKWVDVLKWSMPALYRKEFFSAETSEGNGNVSFVGQGGGEPENGGDGGVVVKSPEGPFQAGYVGYDLSELGLRDRFTVEVKVKGEDLKRSTGYYYLFGLSDWGSVFNSNSLGFGLKNGAFWVNVWNPVVSTPLISLNTINNIIDNTWKIYALKFEFNTNQNTVRIVIDQQEVVPFTQINWHTASDFSSIRLLNIAWVNSNILQWNKAIMSFKIYSK